MRQRLRHVDVNEHAPVSDPRRFAGNAADCVAGVNSVNENLDIRSNQIHGSGRGSILAWLMLAALFLWGGGSVIAGELFSLPADPSIPVAEMWYVDRGELGPPEITIFAGGRVQVRVGEGSLWGELSRDQVQSLVHSLLSQDQIVRLQTAEIDQAVAAESQRTGLSCHIQGAGDTIIRVRTANTIYRVDGHAVGVLSNRFPNVECLRCIYSAQCRLENVRAVIMVGGTPVAERLARIAQSQLQVESGEVIPVGLEHLSCVHSLADGTRCCQFTVPSPQGGDAAPRIVSLFESPGETPRVSVLPDGPSLR